MESGTCWTIDGQIELNHTWYSQEIVLYPNRFHLPVHVEENTVQTEVLHEESEDLVFRSLKYKWCTLTADTESMLHGDAIVLSGSQVRRSPVPDA